MRAWLPTASDEVVRTAVPVESSGTWPRTVVPSRKVTIPVGVAGSAGDATTVAVSATGWPSAEGLGEPASVVAEAFAWTL